MTEDDHHFGTIEASANRLGMIIDKATLNALTQYNNLFVYASEDDGLIETIANQATDQAVSYCTFEDNVEVEGEFQALFNIEDFYDVYELVRGDGTMKMEFYGDESSEIPAYYKIKGELEGTVYVKSSESDLEHVSRGITTMFDDDDNFQTENTEITTEVTTDISSLERVLEAKDSEGFSVDHYPFTVKDEHLYLQIAGSNSRNSIEGTLRAENVEGEDVENYYGEPFSNLVTTLSGVVEIETAPGSVLATVQEDGSDVYRHMLMPAQ